MLFADLSSERVVRALKKEGFKIILGAKHIGMSNGTKRLTIPRQNKLNPYTLKSIIKDAGLTDEAFSELLK